MPAPRLSEEQKTALVARYRTGGVAATELALEYGCSAATVTRVVKAALTPEEYDLLKQGRGRAGRSTAVELPVASEPDLPDPPELPPELPEVGVSPVGSGAGPNPAGDDRADADGGDHGGDQPGELAIDDADDFGDDTDSSSEGEAEGDDDDPFVTVPVMPLAMAGEQLECRPLDQADLPSSAYMLVDKTVELEARPLREMPELGQLPPEEEERRALVVYSNPRKAKQLCGRSQRVIKLPDPWVLHRTARYLVAQGITRVVVEGSLYSLPGS